MSPAIFSALIGLLFFACSPSVNAAPELKWLRADQATNRYGMRLARSRHDHILVEDGKVIGGLLVITDLPYSKAGVAIRGLVKRLLGEADFEEVISNEPATYAEEYGRSKEGREAIERFSRANLKIGPVARSEIESARYSVKGKEEYSATNIRIYDLAGFWDYPGAAIVFERRDRSREWVTAHNPFPQRVNARVELVSTVEVDLVNRLSKEQPKNEFFAFRYWGPYLLNNADALVAASVWIECKKMLGKTGAPNQACDRPQGSARIPLALPVAAESGSTNPKRTTNSQ